MASKEAIKWLDLYRSVGELEAQQTDIRVIRAIFETLHLGASEPEGVSYAEVDADGVPAMWCIPEGCDADRVLLDCHSGGTLVHSMYSDRKLVGHIAKAAGVRALVVHFRRSPEDPYPAQVEDVATAYRWLLAQGIRPENVGSIGHSIGGNLCTGLVMGLRDQGAPMPAAILSVSPWYDMEMTCETMETKAATDVMVSKEQLGRMRDAWLGGTGVAPNDPRVNLLYADLRGLPPMKIYYGGDEVLAGDAIEFAKRAEAAGVDVSLIGIPEMQHSFIFLAGRVPEVNEAIGEMGRWLRSKLGLPPFATV
jgi:monoterpene epsilon-lactone hydrolase